MSVDASPRVEIKILDERLRDWGLPLAHSAMAAGVDLRACLDAPLALDAGAPAVLIPAGFALSIANPNIAALILPRSGAGHKRGLVLGNGVGLIDADYHGPIMISAWNRNAAGDAILIEPGERIAQMLFVPVLTPRLQEVAEFSGVSERGDGGFGSTG
ncbi:dUTP pyrophosphatase [Rhodopseudomonas julia]|uniref:dUTP diphosphatase n=1 Tax=Rhodopseudomonas julia TaxID=200617 RepID=A0ABU0C456_9BRAD|nr:dUTP diphosphatase [Rhodopseudomonas julia]MDQ0325291.1 dUTP pyrophosphatase [Rhodopseudomonas julia]